MNEKSPARQAVTPLHRPARSQPASAPEPGPVAARAGKLTATHHIRYVSGPEADRIAARQAKAIAALLRWMATRDRVQASLGVAAVIDLDVPDSDDSTDKAA
ncbi:hypothetical protein [Nocardia bovistercoris]|uniref:Uncharacterized protein n=1 Tax=Nocardia bovistercoris TaxID=2785916 RepID=A0A931ICK6_9NOCA|nr:hypothetical protein [Nocardia bovistercoris]MBH0777677.1 hypothetical protein [Nocardia bovistercoris]